ncbi:hypothetical protein ABMA28_006719, partial [Loxostege sticticalis]
CKKSDSGNCGDGKDGSCKGETNPHDDDDHKPGKDNSCKGKKDSGEHKPSGEETKHMYTHIDPGNPTKCKPTPPPSS